MRFLLVGTLCSLLLLPLGTANASFKWGFFAHMQINRMAVFTLPPEMFGFYKRNLEYLTKHAVDPDKMRYLVKEEGARHFMDLDHYPELLATKKLMRWNDAVTLYSEDTLQSKGILPWNIELTLNRLTKAFVERDSAKILRYSAYLGHYLADASVPLHTTSNYNGQLTGQKGIHGFWETRLPVLFSSSYDQLPGRAGYIDHPLDYVWKHILQCHNAVDSVLKFEAKLNSEMASEQKYGLVEKNKMMVSDYSEKYSEKYHQQLNGMVERQMISAIHIIGCYWYTAWKNAGQPSLNNWKIRKDDDESPVDSLSVTKRTFKVREEE
ncbi:hypothetical protein D3C80_504290 [compost metagenome]